MTRSSGNLATCLLGVLVAGQLAHAQVVPGGCQSGEPNYVGDWARRGCKLSLNKVPSGGSCFWRLGIEMIDQPRFHSNPHVQSMTVYVNVPSSGATSIPYVIGQRVYNVTLNVVSLPCNGFSACPDYLGGTCDQTALSIIWQINAGGCPGSTAGPIGIVNGETLDSPNWDFTVDPTTPCLDGNPESYGNTDQGIYDVVAYQTPDPVNAGRCWWNVNMTLTPDQKFKYSNWLDFVSFRGTGPTNYGAAPRLFFKGQELYQSHFVNTDCADTVLNIEILFIEEYLGQYPNFKTGYPQCPFQSFRTYQLTENQRYRFYTPSAPQPTGISLELPAGAPASTDARCSTAQPPLNKPCPAMILEAEVIRGVGAYYDSTCSAAAGGSWAGYASMGNSCCRTCVWNTAAVAGFVQRSDLLECPPCVKDYYERVYSHGSGTAVPSVPLSLYNRPDRCPYTNPAGGNMSQPVWLYNPDTDKCYFKSSVAKGRATSYQDAVDKCNGIHGAEMLNIESELEDDWVRLNLLWTGALGEAYMGLRKEGSSSPTFDNTWYWLKTSSQTTTPLVVVQYQHDHNNFNSPSRGLTYSEPTPLCAEISAEQPRAWHPASCTISKQYICERPAVRGGDPVPPPPIPPATPPPPPAGGPVSPAPPASPGATACSNPPTPPTGTVRTIMLVNAGGPAICGFAADVTPTPVAAGGVQESWYSAPGCTTCTQTPTLACTACTVRYGAHSYTANNITAGSRYTLRFTFTEVWWTAAGSRTFNVQINGVTVLTGLDPFALAGARFTPVTREVTTTATSSRMTVALAGVVDNPIIAALEIYEVVGGSPVSPSPAAVSPSPSPVLSPSPAVQLPSPTPNPTPTNPSPSPSPSPTPPSPSPSPSCSAPAAPAGAVSTVARINCGGPAICGYSADTAAAPVATTGVAESWYGTAGSPCATCAASPTNTCTACTVRFGAPVSYSIPVTAGNRYTLRFTFSEVYFTTAASRVFSVVVNGATVLAGVDVYATVGARWVGMVREVNVTSTSATLSINLVPTVNNAIMAALEVYDMGAASTPPTPPVSPSPSPPYTSPSPSPSPSPSAGCSITAPPGAARIVVAINAGGPAICGLNADMPPTALATGGVAENWVYPGNPACAGCTNNPTINCTACTVRFGGSFSYSVPANSGRTYMLRFTFSEVWWTLANTRLFNVLVNGQIVLTAVDAFVLAGGQRWTPAVREVMYTAPAGTAGMTVTFQATRDNAILAALEVYEMMNP